MEPQHSDKFDRIGSTGILSNARVGVVHFVVLFIHNQFHFENENCLLLNTSLLEMVSFLSPIAVIVVRTVIRP